MLNLNERDEKRREEKNKKDKYISILRHTTKKRPKSGMARKNYIQNTSRVSSQMKQDLDCLMFVMLIYMFNIMNKFVFRK